MTLGRRRFQRLCALVLLALAASPLTAPFSAGHPLDLLGGATAHVQSKKAPDDPIVSVGIDAISLTADTTVTTEAPRTRTGRDRGIDAIHLPLRL